MTFTRADHIHAARVYLREATIRRMRGQHRMANMLLRWAGNARRRARESRLDQGELFGAQPR